MSSNAPECVGDGSTLSACILAALEERSDDEVMFGLLRHRHCDPSKAAVLQGSSGAVNDREAAITVERVTKRVWCTLVELLKRQLVTSSRDDCSPDFARGAHGTLGDALGMEDKCDVGIYSQETFYTCLVESVCLCMGWTFCLFRPDDPPLRLQRLEQCRRPRCKLRTEDIALLLHAALSAEENSASNREPRMAGVGTEALTQLPVARIDDRGVAYYMYTSGSTGDPKCVVASRGNLRAYLQHFILDKDGLGVRDASCRFFCLSSPFFDPSIGDMLVGLCTPHSVFYTCTREDLLNGQAAPLLAFVQPTHVVSTPAVWSSLTTTGLLSSLLSPSTAPIKVFLGGERMSQELISTWADRAELYNIYGVTEATVYQSVWRIFPGTRAEHVKCGPGVGTKIRVQRLNTASDVLGNTDAFACEDGLRQGLDDSAGDDYGEVVLYGDQVCCGYTEDITPSPFGFDAATGERFFRTGDIGRLVSTGKGELLDLELCGRQDWEMKLNGQRVALEEVEGTVQRALAGLFSECVCFRVQSASGTIAIGAAVVLTDAVNDGLLRDHREGVTAALQELLALHLPSFMVPCRWLLFANGSSLPQTPTGKVNRTQLAVEAVQEQRAELDIQLSEKHDGYTGEEDELYRVVQSVWQRMLGVPVRCDTHYLHSGGDSLGALKLSRAVYLELHASSDAGIDEHGRLPPPFQPCVLLQHPRFGDYVQTLREAQIQVSPNGESKPGNGETVTAFPLFLKSPQVLSPEETAADFLFREVVAAQCAGLANHLLYHGLADVNGHYSRNHRCITPLHVAVASCSSPNEESAALRVVEVLLQHGARLTAVTPDGVTAAHLAASRSVAILRRLLDHDQTVVHCRDARKQSLLHFAARSGNAEIVGLLHHYGLKVDTRDKWQRTPVHWAVLNGHTAVLEEMVLHYISSAATTSATAATKDHDHSGVGAKRRRCPGNETARFTRLARKRTHLAYETVHQIVRRLHPTNDRIRRLCNILAPSVGEASVTE